MAFWSKSWLSPVPVSAAGHMAKRRASSGLVRDAHLVRRVEVSGSSRGLMNRPSEAYSSRV